MTNPPSGSTVEQIAATIWTWEQAALLLGQYLSRTLPPNYTTLTPSEWFEWAAAQLQQKGS